MKNLIQYALVAALAGSMAACGTTRPQVAPAELPRVNPERPQPTTWLPVEQTCDATICTMTVEAQRNLMMNLADIERWVKESTNLLDFYENDDDNQNGRGQKESSLDPR